MKKTAKLFSIIAILAMALAIATTSASAAALNSTTGTVTLQATVNESLTVTITNGAVTWPNLLSNTAGQAGNTTTTVKTSWTLATGRTAVATWAWVASTTAALTDGAGDNIPAAAVSATATGANQAGGALNTTLNTSANAPTLFSGTAGASGVEIASANITGANRASSNTATITWTIDTTQVPQLPAATYNGTVNIAAQATP